MHCRALNMFLKLGMTLLKGWSPSTSDETITLVMPDSETGVTNATLPSWICSFGRIEDSEFPLQCITFVFQIINFLKECQRLVWQAMKFWVHTFCFDDGSQQWNGLSILSHTFRWNRSPWELTRNMNWKMLGLLCGLVPCPEEVPRHWLKGLVQSTAPRQERFHRRIGV